MSELKLQFILTKKSYAERQGFVRSLQSECALFERGEAVDLDQTAAKLKDLVLALNQDRIAMDRTKISRELREAVRAHEKDLNGLTVRVNALLARAHGVPAWVKPVVCAVVAVSGLALTAFIASRSALFTGASPSPRGATSEGSRTISTDSLRGRIDPTVCRSPSLFSGSNAANQCGLVPIEEEIIPENPSRDVVSLFPKIQNILSIEAFVLSTAVLCCVGTTVAITLSEKG